MLFDYLKNTLKVVITACLSLLLCVVMVNPAVANIINPPDMGDASIRAIQENTNRAQSQNPYADQERERTQVRKKELNLVRDKSNPDREKIYNEGSSKSDRTITQQIENALEDITGSNKDQ